MGKEDLLDVEQVIRLSSHYTYKRVVAEASKAVVAALLDARGRAVLYVKYALHQVPAILLGFVGDVDNIDDR